MNALRATTNRFIMAYFISYSELRLHTPRDERHRYAAHEWEHLVDRALARTAINTKALRAFADRKRHALLVDLPSTTISLPHRRSRSGHHREEQHQSTRPSHHKCKKNEPPAKN
jgi:hypothetical protein